MNVNARPKLHGQLIMKAGTQSVADERTEMQASFSIHLGQEVINLSRSAAYFGVESRHYQPRPPRRERKACVVESRTPSGTLRLVVFRAVLSSNRTTGTTEVYSVATHALTLLGSSSSAVTTPARQHTHPCIRILPMRSQLQRAAISGTTVQSSSLV
jgi:hypothetical protein